MKKTIVAFTLFLTASLAGAETWRELWTQTHAQSVAVLQQLPQDSWSSESAAKDLDKLIETLSQLQSRSDWTADEVRELRTSLGRARQNLRISLAPTPVTGGTELLANVERIENGLKKLEDSFSGAHVPSPQQVAASDVSREWRLPGNYDGPADLERVARSIRLDVQSLWGPLRFAGAGIGYGPFGMGYGSGFTVADRQRLIQAAHRYEQACMRAQDPRDTYPAFVELSNAYDRVAVAGIYNSLSIRSIERQVEQLHRFYAALMPE